MSKPATAKSAKATNIALPVIEEPYIVLQDASKLSFFYLRQQINAFLNSRGGTIAIGFNDYLEPLGVRKTAPARDEFRCQVDALVNASQPQVDSDCVSTQFVELRSNYFVIYVFVKPGREPVYFTCYSKAQAFVVVLDYVRLLSQNEVLRRYAISREQALSLEESNREIIIQEQVIQDAVLFSYNEQFNTRVICLEGPKHSGKTWLVSNIKQQIQYDHSLELNFKKFRYLDEAYLELIRQLDPSFKINYAMQHVEISPVRKIRQLEDLFSSEIDEQEECQVLQNIYMNMFDFSLTYLLIIYNLEISADRFIPKGKHLIVLLTGNNYICCEAGPACYVAHLETKYLTPDDMVYLVKSKLQFAISAEFAARLLSSFEYDTSVILSKLESYSGNLEALERQIALWSFSSLILFYELASEEEKGVIKPLCIVPDKFNLSLATYLIGNANLLFRISYYITAKNGYYRIDEEVKEHILGTMRDDEILKLEKCYIDYYYIEISDMNYKLAQQYAKGTPDNVRLRVFGKSLQDWINHNLINLEAALDMCLKNNYKEVEMLRYINVVIAKRVSSSILEKLDCIKSKCGLERSE